MNLKAQIFNGLGPHHPNKEALYINAPQQCSEQPIEYLEKLVSVMFPIDVEVFGRASSTT